MNESYHYYDMQGLANVGVKNKCTIVPINHFGPVPGVPVGSLWSNKILVSI